VQELGTAGESVSLMLKSPSTSSGTPAGFELCWIFPSFAQNSVANTLAPALLPTALPEPRRRARPSTRMLPSRFTSAVRSRITQIWPAAGTPRTEVLAEPVGITPTPPLNLTKFGADSAMAATTKTIPIIVVVFFTISPFSDRYQGCIFYGRRIAYCATESAGSGLAALRRSPARRAEEVESGSVRHSLAATANNWDLWRCRSCNYR